MVRDYYKSGTIPVLSISANTFGIEGSDNADYVCPGRLSNGSKPAPLLSKSYIISLPESFLLEDRRCYDYQHLTRKTRFTSRFLVVVQ